MIKLLRNLIAIMYTRRELRRREAREYKVWMDITREPW